MERIHPDTWNLLHSIQQELLENLSTRDPLRMKDVERQAGIPGTSVRRHIHKLREAHFIDVDRDGYILRKKLLPEEEEPETMLREPTRQTVPTLSPPPRSQDFLSPLREAYQEAKNQLRAAQQELHRVHLKLEELRDEIVSVVVGEEHEHDASHLKNLEPDDLLFSGEEILRK